MKQAIILLLFVPLLSFGQDTGIHFLSGISWEEVKAKAKQENKYIFVDCFASWCGPCKWMSQHIFVQDKVGEFFNRRFLSVAVQMDRTGKDSNTVKSWYQDAKTLEVDYSIGEYPTYLFFDPDGNIVHRYVNSTRNAEEFIAVGADAIDSTKQYYTIIRHLNAHQSDSAYLRAILVAGIKGQDLRNVSTMANYYAKAIRNFYQKENLKLFISATQSSHDSLFPILAGQHKRIDSVVEDPLGVEYSVGYILCQEELFPLFNSRETKLDWRSIINSIARRYPLLSPNLEAIIDKYLHGQIQQYVEDSLLHPGHPPDWLRLKRQLQSKVIGYPVDQILAEEEPKYYWRTKQYAQCSRAAVMLLNHFGRHLTADQLNNIAWRYVFLHSSDTSQLTVALRWSKRSLELDTGVYNYLDTYANLLYKTGKSTEAVKWEGKAVEAIEKEKDNDPESFQELRANIQKMTRHEKTWIQ